MIFSLHLGVGHSVLLQLEGVGVGVGVGHVFSNHHISKCSPPPYFLTSSLIPFARVNAHWVIHWGQFLPPHNAFNDNTKWQQTGHPLYGTSS